MAANTPVVWFATGETGVRCDEVLRVNRSPYAGAGAHRETRWQVSTTNSFPASSPNLEFDTGLREDNGHDLGPDWVEIPLENLPAVPSTTYYLSTMDRNTLGEASSWATAVSFTTAAEPSAADWREAQ